MQTASITGTQKILNCSVMTADVVLYHNGAAHQAYWIGCFSDGLKRHGVQHVIGGTNSPQESGIGVLWGIRQEQIIKSHEDVIIMERGYFGDRLEYTSCGWNGLNGRADFNISKPSASRWEKHGVKVIDWHKGEYILLMGQVQGDMSTSGINLQQWYAETVRELRNHTSMPIVFRPHPLSRPSEQVNGCVTYTMTLSDALARAAVCVTLNSNSGVDAILAGTPLITSDDGAMARPVSRHTLGDINKPYTPDRSEWLHDLAYCQWNESEIRSGLAWDHLSN